MPTISVILPVYNASDHISEGISSILNQTFKDFELLIINDGSTDDSKDKICSFSDFRIRFIENEENKGLIYTLNRGINESNGKYIVRMDADDIAFPNRFEKQYNYMELHPKIGACGSYAEYFGDKSGQWKYPILNKEIRCRLMWGSSIIHPTAIIRKSILTQSAIRYNEDYLAAEDYKLWVDISGVSDLYNIPEVLLKYRVHNKQVTTTKGSRMNHTKSKIIFEQIASVGVNLSESDFGIISKFILYTYNFKFSELNRLFDIYIQYIKKNELSMQCEPNLINSQIKDRLFEACYFSTSSCGINSIKLYKKYYTINEISLWKRLKFYYKAIKR